MTRATTESASVGNEGVVGISLFMGGNSTSCSAIAMAQVLVSHVLGVRREEVTEAAGRLLPDTRCKQAGL